MEIDNPTAKYANATNPSIAAILDSLYRFANRDQALNKIASLRSSFIVSRHINSPSHTLVMWIKGFGVSEKEKTAGYTGHFAVIADQAIDGGKFTLTAKKLDIPLKQHPQRKRAPSRHPDWGHPVLRGIRKGKIYSELDDANAELTALHEAFPEVSIPAQNALYIMIYSRKTIEQSPIQKYKLEIGPISGGGFIIVCKENNKKTKAPRIREKKPAEGYFSSMVQLKKKKRTVKKQSDNKD